MQRSCKEQQPTTMVQKRKKTRMAIWLCNGQSPFKFCRRNNCFFVFSSQLAAYIMPKNWKNIYANALHIYIWVLSTEQPNTRMSIHLWILRVCLLCCAHKRSNFKFKIDTKWIFHLFFVSFFPSLDSSLNVASSFRCLPENE